MEFEGRERLLDPDAIARRLNPSNPSAAAVAAGREALNRTAEYLREGLSFAVETTLSGHGPLATIREAKAHGFTVHLVFVAVDTPVVSIARVRNRTAQGGHFVPDADVRRRYARSLANAALALSLADVARFYDNSAEGHRLVLEAQGGQITWQSDPTWLSL
jgi:predicted ABC-type ATPase